MIEYLEGRAFDFYQMLRENLDRAFCEPKGDIVALVAAYRFYVNGITETVSNPPEGRSKAVIRRDIYADVNTIFRIAGLLDVDLNKHVEDEINKRNKKKK